MNTKNKVLGLAIMILAIFVYVYGVGTFYPEPNYTDFCNKPVTAEFIDDPVKCAEIGGEWIQSPNSDTGWCDKDNECNNDYQTAKDQRNKAVFLFSIIIGLIGISGGMGLFKIEEVSLGMMAGGVGVMIYGILIFWAQSGALFRFLTSLVALSLLIYVAYVFNDKTGKKKFLFFLKKIDKKSRNKNKSKKK